MPAALAVFLGLLAGCDAVFLAGYALYDGPIHMDFFGIWSWARFEIELSPTLIYDRSLQGAYLMSLDPQYAGPMPFPYPPPYLLMIRPLGYFSYSVAQAIWSGTTLLAYLLAVSGRTWRSRTALLALLAPATLVNLIYGQNGFLTAALLVGGIRLAPKSPLCGGMLLGLLAYKPQFGLLVAIALVAGGRWRAAGAAAATVVAMAAVSVLTFGFEPWAAWIRALPDFVVFMDSIRAHALHLMPTATANALILGAGENVAAVIQFAFSGFAALSVWLVFRRAPDRPAAAAVLAVATVLASPYAFVYDLTLVGAAIALLAGEVWKAFSKAEILVLAAATVLPVAMWADVAPPIAAAVHLGLLGLVWTRLLQMPSIRTA